MSPRALVIGSGPAGLSAAEVLAASGWLVTVVEAHNSPARKLLRAGVGGLNLTHSQPFEDFLDAYDQSRSALEPFLRDFGPSQLQSWAQELGLPLFTGTSGRVFPKPMSAAPLLDLWLDRLSKFGVVIKTGTRWVGWNAELGLAVEDASGGYVLQADAVVLALGGPTWPTLGTGGRWVPLLEGRGVKIQPWKPANVGFTVNWSPYFRDKFSGQPLKETVLRFEDETRGPWQRKGELMVTDWGLEGSLLYAAGARLRDRLEAGRRTVHLDLMPGRELSDVEARLSRPRGGRSLSTHLQKVLGLPGVKIGLLREVLPPESSGNMALVTNLLKHLPVNLGTTRPIDEAISAAGGVAWDELTGGLELKKIPGVWCAGEMIDWEAPTGGYLLTACFSLGRAVGKAMARRFGQVAFDR